MKQNQMDNLTKLMGKQKRVSNPRVVSLLRRCSALRAISKYLRNQIYERDNALDKLHKEFQTSQLIIEDCHQAMIQNDKEIKHLKKTIEMLKKGRLDAVA
jgi:hypothetical protein